MAETSAIAPAWLVWIETQSGPRPQVWFDDAGRCVGPSDLVELARYKLPRHLASAPLSHLANIYPITEAKEAA